MTSLLEAIEARRLRAAVNLSFGGAARDHIAGGDARDWLYGGGEADIIAGGGGNNVLRGNGGNDTLISLNIVPDTLFGDGGRDTAVADAGDDVDNLTSIEVR